MSPIAIIKKIKSMKTLLNENTIRSMISFFPKITNILDTSEIIRKLKTHAQKKLKSYLYLNKSSSL